MSGLSPLFALDIALTGAVSALLALIAGQLLRSAGRDPAARLGAAFALGGIAHAVISAWGFQVAAGWWAAMLVAVANGGNLIFWLFARALFDDGFKLRPWHAAAWLGLVGASLVGCRILAPAHSPLTGPLNAALTLSALGLAALAALQTLASWRADLIEQRRRLRVFIVGGLAGYTVLTAVSNLVFGGNGHSPLANLVGMGGLAALVGAIAWSLLRLGDTGQLFVRAATPQTAPAANPPAVALDPADLSLIEALRRLMGVERAYRQESLTIGALAARLGLPEHRLRRLINQGLGHRNFNSFLNLYRIADAAAALSDPSQAGVPILTIALDAGFNSLGPFNRAFKAETGVTPSAYRRAAVPPTAFTAGAPVPLAGGASANLT